ncbi:MAG: L,D-transpeptidase family protein, partial [Pseudolabrys sp.]
MTTALPRRFPTGAPTRAFSRGTIAAAVAMWTLGAIVPAQAQTRPYAGLFDWLDGPRAEVVPDEMPRTLKPKPQIKARDKARNWARDRARARKAHDAAIKLPAAKIPAGPMQLIVSTARQRVTWYSNGIPVAEAPVSTGVPGHPTPLGIFSVIGKSRHHKSNIYSDAPMPYMHRITWSGIALHQGVLPGRPASHGCIRLPESFASRLFATSKLGARVIVTRDPAAPVTIDSARLIAPAEAAPAPSADLVPEAQRVIERAAAESGVLEKPASPANQIAGVQVADVTGTVVDGVPPVIAAPRLIFPAEMPNRKGPVQAFVSRKDGKLYVRLGFAPLFETAVTIAEPKQPWGTHVVTEMEIKDG